MYICIYIKTCLNPCFYCISNQMQTTLGSWMLYNVDSHIPRCINCKRYVQVYDDRCRWTGYRNQVGWHFWPVSCDKDGHMPAKEAFPHQNIEVGLARACFYPLRPLFTVISRKPHSHTRPHSPLTRTRTATTTTHISTRSSLQTLPLPIPHAQEAPDRDTECLLTRGLFSIFIFRSPGFQTIPPKR